MEKWRQKLHLEAPDGWLNDPNGLCFFKGKYHVFFQYSPKSAEGKTARCWGHFSGEKLTELEYNGIALSPDIPEDKDGVYSGCAVTDGDTLHLFYTGNVKEDGDYDYITAGRGANVIHVTSQDGYTMSEKQVLLRNSDYPDFCSCHVRDPKIWRDGNVWKMVLGARTLDDIGCVLIYSSDDLENWSYQSCVSAEDFGYMWECPDYFKLGEKGFLSISPQGIPSQENKYQNVYQSGYFSVSDKLEDNRFGEFSEWDMGFDFYAPQTFEAPDGRRILIGWMGIGDADYTNPTIPLGWQHCLTLPREITVGENGKLLQKPLIDFKKQKKSAFTISNGEKIEIGLPFELYGEPTGDFTISLDDKLCIRFEKGKKLFTLEFSDFEYGGGRTIRRAALENCSKIRIIADMSSLEIYLNGGETVFSTRFYPNSDFVTLSVCGISAEVQSLE